MSTLASRSRGKKPDDFYLYLSVQKDNWQLLHSSAIHCFEWRTIPPRPGPRPSTHTHTRTQYHWNGICANLKGQEMVEHVEPHTSTNPCNVCWTTNVSTAIDSTAKCLRATISPEPDACSTAYDFHYYIILQNSHRIPLKQSMFPNAQKTPLTSHTRRHTGFGQMWVGLCSMDNWHGEI